MKYSIIIPTHNHCDDLLKPCIESIVLHTSLLDSEIIVVANGCTDNTKEYIEEISKFNKNIKLIWIDDAIGFTKSTNIGINQAKGEFTILLNNDCQILPSQKNQWLDILNLPFENEKVGMTGIHEIFSEETKQNFLVFYCVMIRSEIFKEIGLLDEVFSPGFGEDIDFCARLLKFGYTFVNCDKNTQQQEKLMVGNFPLYHAGSSTFHDKNHSEEYEKIVKRNIEILKRRYGNINKKVKYSIVIPTYNRCDELLKPCLESIKRTTDLSDVEVIVVANGCVDNTEEYVNSLGEPFKLFVYKEQLGYTKATNVGLKAAIGEYIILLNNDVIIMPHENWLNILKEPFEKYDRVGMTGPMLFKGVEGQSNDFIMFFCAMTTRNVIEEVGYLDEIFSPGGVEDVDYGLRMKLANYKLIEVPENTETSRSHAMSSGVFPIFHPGGSTVTKEKGWNEILVRNNEILKKKFPEHFHGLDWIEKMNKNKQKVYDCFSFYNELDLLDIRLNELNDVVDYFVISEATETHQGDKKPLYFQENKDRYSKYKDKIIHIIVDDFKKYNNDDIKQYWEREQWQRHSLYKGLANCKENDIILISDVDEIPRADVISRYTNGIKSLEQKLYYYDFNHLANETWKKAKILQYKDIIDSNYIFSSYFRNDEHDCITNAGWHFSYNSDTKDIIKKLKSFSHKEFNSYPFTDEEYINSCISNNINLFDNNKLNFVEIDNYYPKCMINNNKLSLHQLMKKEDVSTYEEIFEINVNKIKKEEVDGKIIIDIGGNKGYFSIQCIELGAKEVYCFEPVKTIYKKLTEFTKGFKNINIYNLAISDGSISEVKINDNGAGSNIWDTDNKIESTKCISLVEALKYVKSDGDMILKLDCEGSEFEILLNTPKEIFQKFSHMYIEIHDEMNPNYFQKRELLLNHIKSLGFYIEEIGPQSGVFYQDGSFVPAPVLVYKFKKNEITIDERGSWSGENSKNYHVLDENLSNTLIEFFKKNNYSVYDFGCGVGFYTKKFIENGIKCKGYDGNPDIKNLSDGICERIDFSEKFQLEKLDVVMSLEVGEHIPEEYENIFLENIHNHNSKYIILSWAIPGQQGLGHVNEKSNEYIKKKIENLGYTNELELENLLRENSDISWFKNSIMVFKKKEKFTIGFIDNDAEIQKKWIDQCLNKINKDEYDIISVSSNNHPAKNYNKIIEQSSNKYIIFLHQDITFSDNFLDIIRETIKQKQNFGVLGIIGFSQMEDLNRITVYSNPEYIKNVDFFDSCCIVINKDHNIKFNDIEFDELHMYVEDYCMQSIEKGFENFTFLMNPNDFVHYGNTYIKNNKMMWGEYGKYYEKFIKKWTKKLNRKTFIWKKTEGGDMQEFVSLDSYLGQKENINYVKLLEKLKGQDKFIYDEIFDWNTYTCTDEELKDSTIIDIGANKGFFSIYAVMHGAKKVYAYEPNKDTFKILCENVKQFKNIIPLNIAAHHPDTNEVYSVGLDGNSTVTIGNNENSVECSSLEQIINSKDLQTENLILKIDCEGSEYDILLPCPAKSLRKFKIIYYEFHDKMHANNDFNFEMLNKYIENIGYKKTKSPIQVFLGHHNSNGDFVPESVIDTTETGKFIRKEDSQKVYDCFPFFNELDLLEIRLEELYDVVDKFVITEANATHSGKQKPLYLTENLNRFEKYKDKIELRVIDLLSELPKSEMNENWVREHIQRNDSIEYLKSVCKDNDYIIVSDIDEIPRKSAIKKYISDKTNSVGVLLQDRYMYFLNYKNLTTDEPQLNSKIITFKLMGQYGMFDLNGVRYCDKENLMPTYIIENGGWHFTFMGGIDKVIEKVKAFAHQEYNVPEKINNDRMLQIFKDGKDVYDAKTTWKSIEIDDSFPERIKEFKQEYINKGWIKTDKKMEIKKEEKLDKKNILCSISTRGRYDTTLPLAIQSVIAQTLAPDALVIFDDNDKTIDLRDIQHYNYLFRMLDEKKISWQIIFGEKKGQHYNHQIANKMGYKWIWRIDDDCVAEPDVLEKLYSKTNEQVGAVGGSILTPPFENVINVTGKIENIKSEPNIQWGYINKDKSVDHLHCSFLYRADIIDYNLSLSKIAHREETLFTYGLKKEGYEVLVTPCVTWHLKNKEGGIRSHKNDASMFQHDEETFDSFLSLWDVKSDTKMIVLDNGIGDHYAFKNILSKLREKYEKITIACCFPDVFHDEEGLQIISINDAKNMMNIDVHNIYRFMIDKRWNKGLIQAFEELYLH